jgi:hypothetical protein
MATRNGVELSDVLASATINLVLAAVGTGLLCLSLGWHVGIGALALAIYARGS